ncbi:DUF4956 domain-containing protein [Enterococcus diestrammenae]|uniref:DUF4956 domain-containing protein n=1 Tax=Enterococcus diestrammenae TaxID=1155073 RepID=A0ABV0F4U2_9ENTE|nr:DUF4956 domain-containing protein [Enterococcus diestrammenae]KAF1300638.1 DUF4956 domain-containing protein [Enterococcus diestrammenae]
MLESLYTNGTESLSFSQLGICMLISLALGLLVAAMHMYRNTYSKNFIITLVILPVLVQSVIMLVNGNLGTGMAVVGAFSLIRFRSVPGGSREITSIFWSMAIGLATGMGYAGFIVVLSVIVAIVLVILYSLPFAEHPKVAERDLKVTIPEDLDYPHLFDDLFENYAHSSNLESVRTTTMGSVYELRYRLLLKDSNHEKELIDEIRVRNGNLPVVLGKAATNRDEL